MADGGLLPGFEADALVIEPDNLPAVCDRAIEILHPKIFQRGDVLVSFYTDDEIEKQPRPFRLTPLDENSLSQQISRAAKVYKVDGRSGELKPVNCPVTVARMILAERRYCFPQVRAVVETPIVMPDGTLLQDCGYSERHELLLHLPLYRFERFDPDRPRTSGEARAALEELRHLLSGFPFEDCLSESVAIAMLMTAVLRPGLSSAPLFATSARAPGTGKTHLQRLTSILATGRELSPIAWPGDEIEFRKLLLAALLGGDTILVIDNLNGVLESDALCVVLTAPEFKQRMLGTNDAVSVPTTALVCVNGNNLAVSGDLVRRTLMCWLNAEVERPETRAFEFDPLAEARADRASYVRAILTIVLAYRAASGKPTGLTPFGSFAQWAQLVREPLVWLGMPDPCSSIERVAALDPVRMQHRAMLHATFGVFGARGFTVPRLVAATKGAGSQHAFDIDDDGADQRRELRDALEAVAERNGEINKRALGRWLAAQEGRIEDGLRFVRAGAKGEQGVVWAVERAQKPAD